MGYRFAPNGLLMVCGAPRRLQRTVRRVRPTACLGEACVSPRGSNLRQGLFLDIARRRRELEGDLHVAPAWG